MPPPAGLTPEQERVVASRARHLQVAAGPGTGKTTTLAHRVERLVRDGTPAHRILVVTFTREATASLARRISLLLGRDAGVDVRSFHSWAARELAGEGLRFLDAADARRLALRAAAGLPSAGGEDTADRFLSFVSYCKNREVAPFAAIRERFPLRARQADAAVAAFDAYVTGQEGRLDFDDLLLAFRDRLRSHEALLSRVAARMDHLLVDEYQDVNRVQHEIVRLLATRIPVTVVGDSRQAIYGFRGGDPAHLADFAAGLGGERLALTRNFRSAHPILDAANRIFPDEDALSPAKRRAGPLPRVVRCESPQAEAGFVADEAWRLLDGGHDAAEIAVLYRSRPLAVAFEDLLRERLASARRLATRAGSRRAGKKEVAKWESVASVARTTIHGAKGLEWDHVFVLGAREGGLPSLFENLPRALTPGEADARAALAEEKRLFYVAVTRARKSVTVTWPERDRGRAQAASRFLAEWLPKEPAPAPRAPPAPKATA